MTPTAKTRTLTRISIAKSNLNYIKQDYEAQEIEAALKELDKLWKKIMRLRTNT
jgi:hypothetical protein